MATLVKSFAIQGVDGYVVDIEAKTLDGQPMISVIGMGDQAVKEAAERIEAAIEESGYSFPKKKIIISLAPSDKKKKGSHFDLAMALAVLQQNQDIAAKDLQKYGVIGELSLDGRLRGSVGVLPMVIAAKKNHITDVIVPAANIEEAGLVSEIRVHGFEYLIDVIRFLEGKACDRVVRSSTPLENAEEEKNIDFSDVKGQNELIDAVILAAAGGHNMLMIGEPGCGKTMVASRIPTILPQMSAAESLEVTKIYSISGLLNKEQGMIKRRPFRAPHHNASLNALIGGGMNASPGEVSLAHNGVLFLDEIAEFSKHTLDALRQPIEDKKVTIARVNGNNTYPANFMFISAMNPCPCGYYPSSKCKCTDYEIIKYRGKISGPIMDRIDIQKSVKTIGFFEISNAVKSESSETIRKKVEFARNIQMERFKDEPDVYCNAQMTTSMIQKYCVLDDESTELLRTQSEIYGYSARVIHKLLRVARTSADLDGSERIRYSDIERVLNCRDLDKSNSELMVVK